MHSLKDYIFGVKDLLSKTTEKVFITDVKGKIVQASDSFLEVIGIHRKEKEKLYLDQLIEKKEMKLIDDEFKGSHHCIRSFSINTSDGKKTFTVLILLISYDSQPVGKVFIIDDESEIKIELNNNLFQSSILRAMDSRNDIVWYVSDLSTGKNIFTSSSIKDLLGWDPRCFTIGGWYFFFAVTHPEDVYEFAGSHNEWVILKNKLGILYEHIEYSSTFRMKNNSGKYVHIETKSNVHERDENGKVKTIIGSFRPIDQKLIENTHSTETSSSVKVIDGKIYVELDYLKKLRDQSESGNDKEIFKKLSSREIEILKLIVDEFSSDEISQKLNISIHTVNLHRKQMMKKLEVKNLAGLIRLYFSSM